MAGWLVGFFTCPVFVYIYTHMHTQLNRDDGRFASVGSFHDVIDRSPRGRRTHAHTYTYASLFIFLCTIYRTNLQVEVPRLMHNKVKRTEQSRALTPIFLFFIRVMGFDSCKKKSVLQCLVQVTAIDCRT